MFDFNNVVFFFNVFIRLMKYNLKNSEITDSQASALKVFHSKANQFIGILKKSVYFNL